MNMIDPAKQDNTGPRGSGRTHKQLMELKENEVFVVASQSELSHIVHILRQHRASFPRPEKHVTCDVRAYDHSATRLVLDHHLAEVASDELLQFVKERNQLAPAYGPTPDNLT